MKRTWAASATAAGMVVVSIVLAACATKDEDACVLRTERYYQPFGGGGAGSFIDLPVKGRCPSEAPTSGSEPEPSQEMPLVKTSLPAKKNFRPLTERISMVGEPIVTSRGLCFDPARLSKPWTLQSTEVPNSFIIEAPYLALDLPSGTADPTFAPSRIQEVLSVAIRWNLTPSASMVASPDLIGSFARGEDPRDSRIFESFKKQGVEFRDGPMPMVRYADRQDNQWLFSVDGRAFCTLKNYRFENPEVSGWRNSFGTCVLGLHQADVTARFRFAEAVVPELDQALNLIDQAFRTMMFPCQS